MIEKRDFIGEYAIVPKKDTGNSRPLKIGTIHKGHWLDSIPGFSSKSKILTDLSDSPSTVLKGKKFHDARGIVAISVNSKGADLVFTGPDMFVRILRPMNDSLEFWVKSDSGKYRIDMNRTETIVTKFFCDKKEEIRLNINQQINAAAVETY